MNGLIATLYGLSMLFIFMFSLVQLSLAWHYRFNKRKKYIRNVPLKYYPEVTVQLPVYNEKYVINRLLDAIAELDYPAEKLEVQVLDDSDDETTGLIAKRLVDLHGKGINFRHIQRPTREGYKAGALQYGLELSKGDYLAIFDADSIPGRDFLKQTLPSFTSQEIGMVQVRWGHLNQDYNLLTRMQAFGLNAHFTIEQGGRQAAGSFINFNGTAGVWRKSCISDAGGWKYDTLTEDLDLSYRAQLRGWKFEYIEHVKVPAELPVNLPALKLQQHRWNKGAAESTRKLLWSFLKSDLSLGHKLRGAMHLLNSTTFFFLFMASVLSVPMLYGKDSNLGIGLMSQIWDLFKIGLFAMLIFYWMSYKSSEEYTSI